MNKTKWIIIVSAAIAIALFLCSCQTPTERAQSQNAATDAAVAKQKKAEAAERGKEADLNRAAQYAYTKLNDPTLGSKILDAQLTLTGPQVTREDLLEQQVRDLQTQNASLSADKSELLKNVAEIKNAKEVADEVAETQIKKGQELTLALAKEADQKEKDDSWGGLYGLFRYALKAFWTLLWIGLALLAIPLVIRVVSWAFPAVAPEIGIALTAIEHGVALVFHLFARIVPGAISAAGWAIDEIKVEFTPKVSPAPAASPPPVAPTVSSPTATQTKG